MNSIFVKPKSGVKIRRPETKALLSPEGENVPNNTFWKRRIADGDVIVSQKIKKQKDGGMKAPVQPNKDGGKK